jgi:hypothetical protein
MADANYRNSGIDLQGHGVLLVFSAPCQLQPLAGQEHGRTIPLADLGLINILRPIVFKFLTRRTAGRC